MHLQEDSTELTSPKSVRQHMQYVFQHILTAENTEYPLLEGFKTVTAQQEKCGYCVNILVYSSPQVTWLWICMQDNPATRNRRGWLHTHTHIPKLWRPDLLSGPHWHCSGFKGLEHLFWIYCLDEVITCSFHSRMISGGMIHLTYEDPWSIGSLVVWMLESNLSMNDYWFHAYWIRAFWGNLFFVESS